MPIVLLLLGVVTTAAGLVLVGSGLSPRDGTFQTEVLTPGTIAAVGGLLLIAFGLAVREMRRIERSFAVRSASRTPRVDDAATVAAFSAATSAPSLPETKLEPPPLPKRVEEMLSGESFAGICPGCKRINHVVSHRVRE